MRQFLPMLTFSWFINLGSAEFPRVTGTPSIPGAGMPTCSSPGKRVTSTICPQRPTARGAPCTRLRHGLSQGLTIPCFSPLCSHSPFLAYSLFLPTAYSPKLAIFPLLFFLLSSSGGDGPGSGRGPAALKGR